jgi:hypothetical protein
VTPLSAFRSRIAPRVPTALDMLIDDAVLDAAIDFCEQTLIVKGTLDQFTTGQGVREYDVEADGSQQAVCKIMRVWCNEREMTPVAEDDVLSVYGYVDQIAGSIRHTAPPTGFNEPSPGVIAFMPVPDGAYPVTVRAAMKPKRSATQVEDILYENWAEEIVHGALFRLFSTEGMPFTNAGAATAHMALFKMGVNKALLEASRGRTRAERIVRVPLV